MVDRFARPYTPGAPIAWGPLVRRFDRQGREHTVNESMGVVERVAPHYMLVRRAGALVRVRPFSASRGRVLDPITWTRYRELGLAGEVTP